MQSDSTMTDVNTVNNLSNEGSFVGNTLTTNLCQTADQFNNMAIGDYTLKPNGSGMNAVDAGTPITGYTPTGDPTPDVGAFQTGQTPWTAGASFKTWLAGNQRLAALTGAVSVSYLGSRDAISSLQVGQGSSESFWSNRRSFMKFDLTGLTDPNSIQNAILRLYENAAPDDGTGDVRLYKVTSGWTPGDVSYSESVGDSITNWYDSTNWDLYTEIDITQWVKDWISNPASDYGLSLRSTSEYVAGSAKWWDGYYGITGPQLILTVPEPAPLTLLGIMAVMGLLWRYRLAI
jgi:hypothetical protein